ncbi:MATE family efflux transporter [Enterococcus sp. DIV0187]|uniref:MATE family efflux transporter n=1 Tax=Enterococcus sp. DIV0187 TaxID=2774644 RepID=UPI003F2601CC
MKRFLWQVIEQSLTSKLFTPKDILKIALPLIVDQGFIIGLATVNTLIISVNGVDAISAVNLVDTVNIFFINIFIAMAMGGTVLIAQSKGKNDQKMIRNFTTATLQTIFLLTCILAFLVILFRRQIFAILFKGSTNSVINLSNIYLVGLMLSYPAQSIVEASCGILRGMADTKGSLFLSSLSNLIYVFLNFFFVRIFSFGIVGMCISVNIARLLGAIFSISYLCSRKSSLNFSLSQLKSASGQTIQKVIRVGIPFSLEQIFFNGGKIVVQTFVVRFGILAVTANAVSNLLTMLIEIVPGGFMLALVPIIAQSIGANDIMCVKKFWKSFLVISSITALISSLAILINFNVIIRFFNIPVSVEILVLRIFIIVAVGRILIWPIGFITPSILRAAGDAKFTSLISLVTMWGIRIVVGYFLSITFNYGIIGVWIAMCIEWCIRGAVFSRRLVNEKWIEKDLL